MYQLNPQFPLVWRTPHCLQIGVDAPLLSLEKLSAADEFLITLLRDGVADVSLAAYARDLEVSPRQLDELLSRLEPALLRHRPVTPERLRIAVDGSGPAAHRIAALLAGHGHRVVIGQASVVGECDVALLVAAWAIEPHRAGGWLRRDVPAIPVVFSDTAVTVGPVYGDHGCLACDYLHRVGMYPHWPAMASQLAGKPSPLETELLSDEIATWLARWLHDGGAGGSPDGQVSSSRSGLSGHSRMILAGANGEWSRQSWRPNSACACQSLRRIESVPVASDGPHPAAPTRVTISYGHASTLRTAAGVPQPSPRESVRS